MLFPWVRQEEAFSKHSRHLKAQREVVGYLGNLGVGSFCRVRVCDCKADDAATEIGNEGAGTTPSLATVLRMHKRDSHSSSLVDEVSKAYGCTSKTSLKYLEATAEQALRYQIENGQSVAHYAWTLVEGGHMVAVALINYNAKDETPMRLRIAFRPSDRGGVPQIAKVFVVQSQTSLILKKVETACNGDASDYLILNFSAPVALRASDRGTAEGIVAVLRSANVVCERLEEVFRLKLRIVESDGLSANLRAERLMQALNPGWKALQVLCSAHRIHAIADKVWALVEGKDGALTGVLRTLLVLQGTTQLAQLTASLEAIVCERFDYIEGQGTLTEAAQRYRHNVLSAFMPQGQSHRKKSVTLLLAAQCNGDWRVRERIQHLCRGHSCCRDRQQSLQLLLHALRTFLKAHKPTSLCKDNWLEWHKPMGFVGILSHVHSLLGSAFQRAFGGEPQDQIPLGGSMGEGSTFSLLTFLSRLPFSFPRFSEGQQNP